ncbi:MAG: alkaline phosphatase [Rikenellaceae bacterium]|nr:alkaline phosphatase [Rikenellaceae bacterium]
MKRSLLFILIGLLFVLPTHGRKREKEEIRNVILLIGDGMGLAHVSMLQIAEKYAPTAFDRAHNTALIVTRSANNRVTDSSAAGTAIATGHKTNNSVVGLSPSGERLTSMMEMARDAGRPTGLVVTCHLQHATPAAFYAHVKHRNKTKEITQDLLRSNFDVLIGGGRKYLREESPEGGSYLEAFQKRGYQVVDTLPAAKKIRSGRLLCVAAEKMLPRAKGRGDFLPQATKKALEILSANAKSAKKGFLVMIEGSQIDHAAHANNEERILAEMHDFAATINVAMDFADRNSGTLVIVAADHETGGLAIPAKKADFTLAENGLNCIFATKGHSATMVPVFLYGTGAERIHGVMDNTQLGKRIMELLGLKK